jgi:hypothetical protein
MICAPVIIATTVLISNRELGELSPYSLQVTLIFLFFTVINPVATTEEDILGFRPAAIIVLELRGLNLNAGLVLNYDRKILAIGHWLRLSPGDRRLRAESRTAILVCQLAAGCRPSVDGVEMSWRFSCVLL